GKLNTRNKLGVAGWCTTRYRSSTLYTLNGIIGRLSMLCAVESNAVSGASFGSRSTCRAVTGASVFCPQADRTTAPIKINVIFIGLNRCVLADNVTPNANAGPLVRYDINPKHPTPRRARFGAPRRAHSCRV